MRLFLGFCLFGALASGQIDPNIISGIKTPPPIDIPGTRLKYQQIQNLKAEEERTAQEARRLELENAALAQQLATPPPVPLAPVAPVPPTPPERPFSVPSSPSAFTGGMPNGRYWNALRPEAKAIFLVAFRDGISEGGKDPDLYFSVPSSAEMVKGVDQFYDDPANAAIPIRVGTRMFVQKLNGQAPDAFASEVASYRRILKELADDAAKKAAEKK